MKKLLLLVLCGLSAVASAQTIPWEQSWARPVLIDTDMKMRTPAYHYLLLGTAFKEIESYIEEIQGKPKGSVKISADYIEYRFGYPYIYRNTFYTEDPQARVEFNDEVNEVIEKSKAGTLTKEDLKGPNWIHLVQALDTEEANCLAVSRKNNVSRGCADQWQDGGLTDDKLVCFKGKTYIKCHVECMEQIYKRKVETTPGPCADAEVNNEN